MERNLFLIRNKDAGVGGGWGGEAGRKVCFHGGKISKVSLTTAAHQCVSSERPSRAETAAYAHTCKAGGSPGEPRASGFPSTLYKKDTFFPLLPAHSNTTHVHEALPTYQRFCQRGQRVGGGVVRGGSLDDVSPPTHPFDSWM